MNRSKITQSSTRSSHILGKMPKSSSRSAENYPIDSYYEKESAMTLVIHQDFNNGN